MIGQARKRSEGRPVWVSDDLGEAHVLERADLQGGDTGLRYDEGWLQSLLHRHPEILPIGRIEPDFGILASVCRELPLVFGAGRTGDVDNLMMTTDGGLVLVETKLWRNPEARRAVVAQAMDYAAATFRLDYGGFEAAVRRARRRMAEPDLSLFELVGKGAGRDESAFVDAVSRNLRLGRAIVAVVGDGIREDIRPLAEMLQSHAGDRFTFALIELAVYETPAAGTRIVVPSILTETTMIERGVVRVVDDPAGPARIVVSEASPTGTTAPRAFGIGEDAFYEQLEQNAPGMSALLKAFLAKAGALGLFPDLQRGLNLKHPSAVGTPLNLGTVKKDGSLDTGPSSWWGRIRIGRPYSETLAGLIGGFVGETHGGRESAVRTRDRKMPRLSDFLPRHEDAWLAAIERYLAEAAALAEASVRPPEQDRPSDDDPNLPSSSA